MGVVLLCRIVDLHVERVIRISWSEVRVEVLSLRPSTAGCTGCLALGCLLCHDCERLIVSVNPSTRITMQSSMLSVLAGQLIEETGLGTS